jgi:hypothetical protein
MAIQNESKLNRLLTEWPRETVSVSSYLEANGYSRVLLNKYVKNRWIKSIGRGAYILSGDRIKWPGAIYALQKQLRLNVHVGGKSALEIKGYSHFLSPELKRLYLYGAAQKLPSWFMNYEWAVEIIYSRTRLFPEDFHEGISEYEQHNYSINISSPERAVFEMLYNVPSRITFNEALLIMENLVSLRPSSVEKLLDQCKFVRVKRLFMYMSEKHGHNWLSQVNTKNINLGQGKIQIVKNGVLDKKYLITIPKEAATEEG